MCGPNQQRLELATGRDVLFTEVDCSSGSCGINEAQLYHLLASGLFRYVKVITNGRAEFFDGGRATAFVASFEAKRESRISLTVNHEVPQLVDLKAELAELKGLLGKPSFRAALPKPVRS